MAISYVMAVLELSHDGNQNEPVPIGTINGVYGSNGIYCMHECLG